MLEDRFHHSRSTVRGQAGMLMELHVRVGFEGWNVCTPISLSNPSPHEQPIETSQLEEGLTELAEWLEGQTAVDNAADASRELAARGLAV